MTTADPSLFLTSLSQRQREVLELLIGGYKRKEISHKLQIDKRTVQYHTRMCMTKLGARSEFQLGWLASQIGKADNAN